MTMNMDYRTEELTTSLTADNKIDKDISVITSTPNEPLQLPKLNIGLPKVQYPQEIIKELFNQHLNKQNSDKLTTIDINDSDLNANNTESSVPSGASSIARMIGDSWLKDSHELDDEQKRLSNSYQHEISVDLNNSFDDNKIQRIPDTCRQLSNFNIDCSLSNQVDTQSEVIGTIKTSIVIENSKEDTNYRQNTSLININTNAIYVEATEATKSSSESELEDESISFEIVPSVDVRNLKILCSKKHKQPKTTKKYFCPYCQTIQTKFARHLELKHRDHQDVQEMMSLSKNTKERRKSIARIRNQGTFMHNMHSDLNTGHLMVARRRQRGKRFKYKTADDYVCCANCKGFYSKATIRLHYVKCDDKHEKGARDILKKCRRKTGYMHPRANEVLRRDVFSVLREGELKNIIAFDELLVLYGNKMCEKCIEVCDHIMIRAELRSLAQHLIVARKIEPKITDYASLLKPKHLRTAVEAVKEVAKWNRKTMRFDVSSNATRLTSSVKKCADKYRSECIQKENQREKKKVDDFIKLWTDEISILLKKKAVRGQQILCKNKNNDLLSAMSNDKEGNLSMDRSNSDLAGEEQDSNGKDVNAITRTVPAEKSQETFSQKHH